MRRRSSGLAAEPTPQDAVRMYRLRRVLREALREDLTADEVAGLVAGHGFDSVEAAQAWVAEQDAYWRPRRLLGSMEATFEYVSPEAAAERRQVIAERAGFEDEASLWLWLGAELDREGVTGG